VSELELGHVIAGADRKRIKCDHCRRPAVACEYMRWALPTRPPSNGIAFYYFCDECWVKPGPYGDSPCDRTGIVVPR
jgi:hypothetical protein